MFRGKLLNFQRVDFLDYLSIFESSLEGVTAFWQMILRVGPLKLTHPEH